MRMCFPALAICALVVALSSREASAVNARVVYTVTMTGGGVNATLGTWGRLMMATIQADVVTRCDTLTDYLCRKPWFSFSSGNKITVFRSDKRISGGQVTGTDKWYISVMDLTTRQFTDLLEMPASAGPSPSYGVLLRWPAGDWVWYHRPQSGNIDNSTGEIWRINVNSPHTQEMLTDWCPVDMTPQNSAGKKLNNWNVSADSRIAMARVLEPNSHNIVHHFPPPAGNVDHPSVYLDYLPNCNPTLSASGLWSGWFNDGGHTALNLRAWSDAGQQYLDAHVMDAGYVPGSQPNQSFPGGSITVDNVSAWAGQDYTVMHWPDFAVNSDRWMLEQFSMWEFDWTPGADVVAFCWKDKAAINVSNNPRNDPDDASKIRYCGDFNSTMFVDGGPANSYQNMDGNWVAVAGTEIIPYGSVSGSNPYTISYTSKPTGAEFFYTIDGSDPTQSSTRAVGGTTLAIPVPEASVVWVKARGYIAGKTPSNIIRFRLLPCEGSGVGITCKLWKNLTGTSNTLADLTTDPRYPNSPTQTWISPHTGMQYGGWWTVSGSGSEQERYGYTLTGYIIPPLTGSYTFKFVSNCTGILRLGTSSAPNSAREIATFTHPYGGTPVQSSPIQLKAGQWYYFESQQLHWPDGYNPGSFGVSWQWPTGSWESSIPKARLMPIDSIPPLTVAIAPKLTQPSGVAKHVGSSLVDIFGPQGSLIATVNWSQANAVRIAPGIYFAKCKSAGEVAAKKMVVGREGRIQRDAR